MQKFGGSSVRDAARLLRSCEIIRAAQAAGYAVAAVLSARGNTTDALIGCAKEITSQPAPRELDALLATGECVSAALGAMMLHRLGVAAVSLTGWQAGIESDGVHGAAQVVNINCGRILQELEAGKVVLAAGFQAVDPQGDITTLGRGGSDTSAVALAAYLNAELCQIYTDVDGVYTTDPRICAAARHLERISYEDMLLLAASGAQVLHDRSVALAKRFSVPLEVRGCGAESRVTRITAAGEDAPVTGITRAVLQDGTVCITAVGKDLPDERLLSALQEALERKGIAIRGTLRAERRVGITVDRACADEALCLVHGAIFGEK